jgi:hypothetical protein
MNAGVSVLHDAAGDAAEPTSPPVLEAPAAKPPTPGKETGRLRRPRGRGDMTETRTTGM